MNDQWAWWVAPPFKRKAPRTPRKLHMNSMQLVRWWVPVCFGVFFPVPRVQTVSDSFTKSSWNKPTPESPDREMVDGAYPPMSGYFRRHRHFKTKQQRAAQHGSA